MNDKNAKHYQFFQNKECEFFPCHETKNEDKFNCMFCYCPLYNMSDCGGNFTLSSAKIKDCSNCLIPHLNRDYILEKLTKK